MSLSSPTDTAVSFDYRKLADTVAHRAQVVDEKITAEKTAVRLCEEKKRKELKSRDASQYDKHVDQLMNPQEWMDRSAKGTNCMVINQEKSDLHSMSNKADWKRCSHWQSSLAKYNARYPGFQFTYDDYSSRDRYDETPYPRCTLYITATPKPTFVPSSTFFSFAHRRFSHRNAAFQSQFE